MLAYYFLLALPACMEKNEKSLPTTAEGKPITAKPVWKPKFYGYPDLPKNEYDVTSVGIGKLILNDSIETILKNYPAAADTFFVKNEVKWRAAIVKPDSGGIIIAETTEAIDLVTFIHTNCKAFTTKEGIKVGMKAKDFAGDTLHAVELNNNIWIVIPNGNILLRTTSPLKLKALQGKGKQLLKEAVITEIGVYCGDC